MKLSSNRWLDANTLLLRAAGIVALLSIPFERLPRRVNGVQNILPFHLARASHLASFLLGIGLLYIAAQVGLRKRNSLYLAVSALVVLIAAELLHYRNPVQLVLYVATLGTLLYNRKQFVVMSDGVSMRRGLLTAASILLVLLVFVAIVFEVIDQQAYGKDLTTSQTISTTYHQLRGDQNTLPSSVRLRRYDQMLLGLLRISGVVIGLIIIASLFQPLKLRRRAPYSHIAYARSLLEKYSTSPEDYFKLWPDDKHYFFYKESFVAYTVSNGIALVLDGATGKPDDLLEVRGHFLDYARLNGWQVAVIHADEIEAKAWQPSGSPAIMKRVYIGSEAFVETEEFILNTIRSKHFRYVRNKATKDGLSFETWQPPLSDSQITQLKTISDSWLGEGGKREYTYMMGYFDTNYLRDCHIALLIKDGHAVAYTNIIPVFAKHVASIDHIRSVSGVSGVAMHYLLMETIGYVAAQGTKTFNLGLAPLSKLDEQDDKNLNERMLAIVKQLGGRYYSFAGLEQFKGKFVPLWDPRYIVYQRRTRLLNVAVALNNVVSYNNVKISKSAAMSAAISMTKYGAKSGDGGAKVQ